ncbi:hypothetical protein LTR86_007248 [Recurvomyces mirabilis]|nr:hypothetical protein LTR86_007248 [Recurvomyces mirabilis]
MRSSFLADHRLTRRRVLGNGGGSSIPPPPQQQQPLHHHPSHHASPIIHPQAQHPPPPNGLAHMHPFDPTRRRSLGGAGSPPQYGGPLEPPPPPPPAFLARNMPPPSPPQMPPPPGSSHLSNAPRGPPTSSPFAGVRDLPGFAPHRPGAGMTISSILGGGEERKSLGSPHMTASGVLGTPKTMPPPSPGRVRASSMRESLPRREPSPPRSSIFGEPRAQSAFHERGELEPRRDVFPSPRFQGESPHSFRAFRLEDNGPPPPMNGGGSLGRPSSQPIEHVAPRSVEEILARRDAPAEGRFGAFRHFAEPPRSERMPRHDAPPFQNGITSQPRERHDVFGSPRMDRDTRQIPGQFPPPMFGTPMREDQAGLFRPVFQQAPDAARESIESRPLHDMRRDDPHYSPNMADVPIYLRGRNGFIDRPITFEEHQRMEATQRDDSRKGSDSSGPRSLLSGISPELNRKGRNSPLPQAVQGAQPRFVGPGGDNPGIKMEFGRMFSGLGSGVGSATPVAGQSANGHMTPSGMSPSRRFEDGDVSRSVSNLDDVKSGTKAKGSRKNGRRAREEERFDGDGRMTPDTQRSNKRSKTNASAHHHHHHLHGHHHHHHHHEPEPQAGSFNMLRFPPNPTPSAAAATTTATNGSAHHHHHHHATHHHHHHAPKPAAPPRKPTVSVQSKAVLDEIASKPQKHLGSQLYTTELTQPTNADIALDSKLKFSSKMKPIPHYEDKENCTFTVRVPRFYFARSKQTGQGEEPSPLEEICKHRQLWGTDIYTDDSDVVAAAAHSGWIAGDFGDANSDLHDLVDEPEPTGLDLSQASPSLDAKPARPVKAPSTHDMHVTVLILPPLPAYASTMQHHVRSRAWDKSHDGMSYMIHRIDFVDEAPATRFTERGITARKQRITAEETRRREAAAGLLMFATGGSGAAVSVGA